MVVKLKYDNRNVRLFRLSIEVHTPKSYSKFSSFNVSLTKVRNILHFKNGSLYSEFSDKVNYFIHLHLRNLDRIILQLNVRKLWSQDHCPQFHQLRVMTIYYVSMTIWLLFLKNSCFTSGYCLSAFYLLTWHLHLNTINIRLKEKCILIPQLLVSITCNNQC